MCVCCVCGVDECRKVNGVGQVHNGRRLRGRNMSPTCFPVDFDRSGSEWSIVIYISVCVCGRFGQRWHG